GVGDFGAGNVISGNNVGVEVRDNDSGAGIDANYIGTDISGSKGVGNWIGVVIRDGGFANIGTSFIRLGTAGQGNVISGNKRDGVDFFGEGSGSVFGNFIGTDATGEHALGNVGDGIEIASTHFTVQVGRPSAGNVIAGNGGDGIRLGDFEPSDT